MSWTSNVGFKPNVYWNPISTVNKTAKAAIESESIKTDILIDTLLRDYSLKALDRFYDIWNFDDFWKRANTCDACLCCADAFLARWPDDPKADDIRKNVQTILKVNLSYFTDCNRDDKWADDLGWWGIMALNAYKFLKKMKNEELAKEYLNLSIQLCWNYMITIAYDKSKESIPVANGCRNNSANLPNEGAKNTVVNALLFLLSTRLYLLHKEEGLPNPEPFLEMAYRQWEWFSKWFDLKEYAYIKSFIGDDEAALVSERPLAFFNGSDYQDKTHPTWSPGWLWSGDQGLLIGALLDMLAMKDNLAEYFHSSNQELKFDLLFDEKIKVIIRKIVGGIQKGLIGTNDHIFREPPYYSSFCTYGADYCGGRGVLIRYLDIKKVKELVGVDFSENVKATINAIWATKDVQTNQFKPEFTTEKNDLEYIIQFGNLWGSSDPVTKWEFTDSKQEDGVSQAIGLDFMARTL